jgi:hypothetical protein
LCSVTQSFVVSCASGTAETEKVTIPERTGQNVTLTPDNKNVRHLPLVNPENVYLPPLHIKVGLMKNFVKGIDQNGAGFAYLKETFPRISDAKTKEGIFVGPQIRELMQDAKFEEQLTQVEKVAWSFKNVTKHFLGNIKRLKIIKT